MKRQLLFMLAFCLSGLVACKKDSSYSPVPREIFLKDVSDWHLPSPAYYFEYDTTGHVIKASVSSGKDQYEIIYDGIYIKEMRHSSDRKKDKIAYLYNDKKQVELIKVINETNIVYRMAELTYNADNQLTKMEWELRIENLGFAIEHTLKFTYDANGNAVERRHEQHAIEGIQDAAVYIDRYEQFDNMVNVNDFELLHLKDRHHLMLLPGVHLQANNPLKLTRTGDGINYEITYSYVYDNLCPIQKKGDMLVTKGVDQGKHFEIGSSFRYY